MSFNSCAKTNVKPVLQMQICQIIPYVESCKHLNNEISTVNKIITCLIIQMPSVIKIVELIVYLLTSKCDSDAIYTCMLFKS